MNTHALVHLDRAMMLLGISNDTPHMAFGVKDTTHTKPKTGTKSKSGTKSKTGTKGTKGTKAAGIEEMPEDLKDMYITGLVRQKSAMNGAGKGVFATSEIPEDYLIGRYAGVPIMSRIDPKEVMTYGEHRRASFPKHWDKHRWEYSMRDNTNNIKGEMIDGWPRHPQSNWIPLINGTMDGDQIPNVEIIDCKDATRINQSKRQIPELVGQKLKGVWYKTSSKINASPQNKIELVADYGPAFFNEIQTNLREFTKPPEQFNPENTTTKNKITPQNQKGANSNRK